MALFIPSSLCSYKAQALAVFNHTYYPASFEPSSSLFLLQNLLEPIFPLFTPFTSFVPTSHEQRNQGGLRQNQRWFGHRPGGRCGTGRHVFLTFIARAHSRFFFLVFLIAINSTGPLPPIIRHTFPLNIHHINTLYYT